MDRGTIKPAASAAAEGRRQGKEAGKYARF